MDISNFISTFVSLMVTGVTESFVILDSISFNGVSLLWYIISIALIGVFLPVLLTLVKTRRVNGRSNTRSKSSSKGSDDED